MHLAPIVQLRRDEQLGLICIVVSSRAVAMIRHAALEKSTKSCTGKFMYCQVGASVAQVCSVSCEGSCDAILSAHRTLIRVLARAHS